jgi:CHRD domain.
MNKPTHFVGAIALVIGLGMATASAETVALKADLKGSNEVPPNASPASGTAEAKLNTETKVLTWTVTYKDLTGPAVGAHFHGRASRARMPASCSRSRPWQARSRARRR